MSGHALAVAAFVASVGAGTFAEPEGAGLTGARMAVGQTTGYVEESILEVGLEHIGWELSAAHRGNRNEGSSLGVTEYYSLTRVVRPDWLGHGWQPFFRIGPAYVRNSAFVGNTNFRLGLGLEWRQTFAAEIGHYSSAGIHKPNTGEETFQIRYMIPF